MNSTQRISNVQRRSARLGVQLESVPLRSTVEARLSICCGKSLEELLVRSRETVVELVSAGPEGVTASLGALADLKDGIVGRSRLEGDVATFSYQSVGYILLRET